MATVSVLKSSTVTVKSSKVCLVQSSTFMSAPYELLWIQGTKIITRQKLRKVCNFVVSATACRSTDHRFFRTVLLAP